MADTFGESKSALELALELGVRADAVLAAMNSMGMEADDPTVAIDPMIEDQLINQMVDSGSLPTSMQSGKGRRKPSDDLFVDDEIVKAGLGASENGYNDTSIPRQITLESSFDEPEGFFKKMFAKKNNLAKSLKNNAYSPEEINSFFSAGVPRETRSVSPFEEQERKQRGEEPSAAEHETADEDLMDDAALDEAGSDEEFDMGGDDTALQAIDDYVPDDGEEGVDEDVNADMDLLGEADLEEMELDPDMMEELEDVDLGDADLDADLADLSDELGLDDLGETEEVGDEDLDAELEEISLDDEETEIGEGEAEEGEEPAEGEAKEAHEEEEDEEEHVPGFIERMLSRVHLTPTETWALMGGSLALMLVLFGVVTWWYLYDSPKARATLYDKAVASVTEANQIAEDRDYVVNEMWKEEVAKLETAADDFKEYVETFPTNLNTQEAFHQLCDITFRLANIYEKHDKPDLSEEDYRQTVKRYQSFLKYIEERANGLVNTDAPASEKYADVDLQKEAHWRIALAQRKLQRYDEAVKEFEDFINRYRTSPDAISAVVEIGDLYAAWANVNKEEELDLLQRAVQRYKDALDMLPAERHRQRSDLYGGLARIEYRLYERSQDQQRKEQADAHLRESIGFYEQSENEARQVENLTSDEKNEIFKPLADLYLKRGKEAGRKWSEYEESALTFPEGIAYRKTLVDEANKSRDVAQEFLNKANNLYDEMLPGAGEDLKQDILYNKTEALFIMRKYPEAQAAGEMLVNSGLQLKPEINAKIHYLLGHIAWEIAKQTDDYTDVKKYYRKALEIDPFYPKEENGEISHLAELRLTNAYFLVDKKYEDAIKRYQAAVENYPSTDYSFLTLYWYGKALDAYADETEGQARDAANKFAGAGGEAQSKILHDKAVKLYNQAVDIYDRAIQTRDDSKYVDVQNKKYLIEIMFNRGHSAFHGEKYRPAEKYLQQALDEYGDEPPAKQYIPGAIERLGDINAILAHYDRAIDFYRRYLNDAYPDPDARVKMKLADAYMKQLSGDQAREWYQRVVRDYGLPPEKGPGFEALKKIAQSYLQEAGLKIGEDNTEEMQKVLSTFDEMARAYPLPSNPKLPNDADSLHTIGNIQYNLQNYPECIDAYTAYLNSSQDPDRKGIVRYRIATAYLDEKPPQPAKAIEVLTNIADDSMDNPGQYADSLILLGQAYEKQADIFKQNGDQALYETYLTRASQAYDRVGMTGVKEKIQQANLSKKMIASILARERELAQNQQQQGG
ncbi:MAG: tetratricopeptide repeat protein [bacterium]|nr:tetratricopeptide repeat protein [bacterium]